MTTKSAFDFTIAEPAAASTAKIESDWIDAPILSKTDWKHGEALTVKHEHDAEKQRRKRDKVKGEVMDLSLDCGEFLRRNWKWIVPLLVFLSVACVAVVWVSGRSASSLMSPLRGQRDHLLLLFDPADSDHLVRLAVCTLAGVHGK